MLRNLSARDDEKKRGIKRTDALRTLCNFMKNVSMEWDMEESEKLTTWYIDLYFESLTEEAMRNRSRKSTTPPFYTRCRRGATSTVCTR